MSINAMLGVSVNTDSAILGRTGLSAVMGQALVSGGATYTQKETFGNDANTTDFGFGYGAGAVYFASRIVAAQSYTLTKIRIYLKRNTSGVAPSFTGKIWSNNGSDFPGTLLATSTNTIVSSDVGTSLSTVDLLFSGQAIASGTPYQFGVFCSSFANPDFYLIACGPVPDFDGKLSYSGDGTSWSPIDNSYWHQITFTSP